MSRCFPFPPPGYSLNTAASNEALIESIKLQKEIARAERKKEKKEKKERKREKKSKDSSKHGFDKAAQESKGKYLFKCLEDKAAHEAKGKCLFKSLGDEEEQLERSNLTEEHGPAVCSQNSSCSSDSTQNSNKRKRPASPSQAGIHAHGSIIRIRLSKKGGQSAALTSKDMLLPKPAPQVTEVAVRAAAERLNPSLKTTKSQGGCPLPVSEPGPSTSGWTDRVGTDTTATASCSKVHDNDIESRYRNLIEMLPPSLPSEHLDFDDQSWLFQRKPKHPRAEEKNGVSNETTCGSCALWPRAQYVPDAGLYALPFTVPF